MKRKVSPRQTGRRPARKDAPAAEKAPLPVTSTVAPPPEIPVSPSKLPADMRRALMRRWWRDFAPLYAAVGRGDRLEEICEVYETEFAEDGTPTEKLKRVSRTVATPSLATRKAFGDQLLLYGLGVLKEAMLPTSGAPGPQPNAPGMAPLVWPPLDPYPTAPPVDASRAAGTPRDQQRTHDLASAVLALSASKRGPVT